MMKDNKKIALFGVLGAMLYETENFEKRASNEDILNRPLPNKIIPTGCKEYFFTSTGSMYTIKPDEFPGRPKIIFECIAISGKSAQRKFHKWFENGRKEAGV